MKDKFYNLIDAMFSELPESSKEKWNGYDTDTNWIN
jgi:hypothetical protein